MHREGAGCSWGSEGGCPGSGWGAVGCSGVQGVLRGEGGVPREWSGCTGVLRGAGRCTQECSALQGTSPVQDPHTGIGVQDTAHSTPRMFPKPAIPFPPPFSRLPKQSWAARAGLELELKYKKDHHPQTAAGEIPRCWHPDPGASQGQHTGSRAPRHEPLQGGGFNQRKIKQS